MTSKSHPKAVVFHYMKVLKNKVYNFLRSLEKYTKTDMVYATKGGLWLTIGQGISAASSLLLAIAFANLLPKETYGLYRYILSIAGILAISSLTGMSISLTQAVSRNYEGSVILAFKTKMRWSLLGVILGLIIAAYYLIRANYVLAAAILVCSILFPFLNSFGIYESLMQGKKQFGLLTKYGVVAQVFSLAVMLATIIFTKNLLLILLAYFLSWTFIRMIFFLITTKNLSPQSVDPEAIPYGKHLSLVNIIGSISTYLDKLLIFHFLGPVEVAIYTVAIAPPEQLKALASQINLLIIPKFSNKSLPEIKETLLRKMFVFGLGMAAVIVLYIVAAPFLYSIIFPQYPDSVGYSQILSLSLVSVALFIPYSLMQSHKMNEELYKFSTYTAIFQILCFLVLIPTLGLWGAVIARIVARLYNLFLSVYFINRK